MDRQQEPKDPLSRNRGKLDSEENLEAERGRIGIGLMSNGNANPPRSILPSSQPHKDDEEHSEDDKRHRYDFVFAMPQYPNPHCGILYDKIVNRSTRTLTGSSSWDSSARSARQNGGRGPVPRPLPAANGAKKDVSAANGNLDRTPRTQLTPLGSCGSAPVYREQPGRLENQNGSFERARLQRHLQGSSREELANGEKPSLSSSGSGGAERGRAPKSTSSHSPQAHNVLINGVTKNNSNNHHPKNHSSRPSHQGRLEEGAEERRRVIHVISPKRSKFETKTATSNVIIKQLEFPGGGIRAGGVGSGVRSFSPAVAVPSSSAARGRKTSNKKHDQAHGGRVGADAHASRSAP